MKYCSNCGTQVMDQFNVCQNCGYIFPAQNAVPNNNIQPDYANQNAQPVYNNPNQPMRGNVQQPVYNNQPMYANAQQMYPNAQPMYANNFAPGLKLQTNRSLLKYILLSIITFGIYGIVVMSKVSTDINLIASKYDGKKTMHYCLVVFVFSVLTLGIVPIVWQHKISARIGAELTRRGIDYKFGAGTFWGWGVLGVLLLFVGPFVYMHKLLKSMNLLSESFNNIG